MDSEREKSVWKSLFEKIVVLLKSLPRHIDVKVTFWRKLILLTKALF